MTTSIELLKRVIKHLELEVSTHPMRRMELNHLVVDINNYLNDQPSPVTSNRVESDDGSFSYVDENGNYHREDGPALFHANTGNKCWYQHGRLHRTDGPAIEYGNGDKSWLIDGYLHRDNGPAIDWREVKRWYHRGDLIGEHLTNDSN